MIGTEFLPGQGLGNRLFCYVTARCLAQDKGVPFGTAGQRWLQADFLALDLGEEITGAAVSGFARYEEAEKRLYLKNSVHDMVHGCYVAGADPQLTEVADNTLVYGNLQDESYFARHREEIRQWLRVRPQFESDEYTAEDLCILNVRGGEYADDPALFLRERYWRDAMALMRRENAAMRFMIVTDDVEAANRLLPEIPAHHFSPEKDYVTVKNARYLIASNSSFAFFPAYTSTTLRKAVAPMYWARHNVSDGYWASEQNIYSLFTYLDRSGKEHSPQECRAALAAYRWPETAPWQPDDPAVTALGRRMERRRLAGRAVRKLCRIIRR
ncbi:MAG: glycosyl transferase [Eubacteriales bacterium]|nr:glycosyl transferase [Eubacteriales bacterium]